ncbi:hypothetical protein O6H91_14G029100 [Diphasiastrum complanatum]|uniref:Uncharacterized protein n=1 Tax=Diphasiastrum complanatum TaxID=34168 RepID=A0ACC2BMP9_DIPCM|nr:hypothetical protein O6H91_14G029100 [Diphasiastrum complanatum]
MGSVLVAVIYCMVTVCLMQRVCAIRFRFQESNHNSAEAHSDSAFVSIRGLFTSQRVNAAGSLNAAGKTHFSPLPRMAFYRLPKGHIPPPSGPSHGGNRMGPLSTAEQINYSSSSSP